MRTFCIFKNASQAFLNRHVLLGTVVLFSQMTPVFSYDSTDIKIPTVTELILCPISPNLGDSNECKLVTASGNAVAKTYHSDDLLKIYYGNYVSSSFNALCTGQGGFDVFSGFASGFSFATGPNITPVDYYNQTVNFYCCKRIVKWVPSGSCPALQN
jgi:hypothetical protein